MDIREVAMSPDHRHRDFAERVLEDDLALWACFLPPMEQMIKDRGGIVRQRVEFSERQSRLEAWQKKVCSKFDIQPPTTATAEKLSKPQTEGPRLTANPDQGMQPVIVVPRPAPGPGPEFGMDDDFFTMLDEGADDGDFFS